MDEGVVEGATRIFPSQGASHSKGPATRRPDAPFYNPAMAANRDLSVLLVAAFADARGRQVDVADVLAGTGARAVRLAHEVAGDVVVHANDADPNAVAAIRRAADANGVTQRVEVRSQTAHALLASRRFDVVDVDPYGSPMPFLDAALRATRHDGLLCLTATDTGALCGTYPKACRRRYAAEPMHAAAWRAEVGLRILIGATVRSAGRFDRAVQPVMAVARGHWMRVVVRVRDGRAAAGDATRQMGRIQEDPRTGQGVSATAGAGPLWQGPLHDSTVLDAMHQHAAGRPLLPETGPLLEALRAEADAPPFWIPLPLLPRRLGGTGPPRRARFRAALEGLGARTWPTHMDPQGLRTDATPELVEAAWRSLL